jgi:hypothetical protein
MKDYTCERLYRDVRITNVYEGTTQLQVVAAIRHVTTGTYLAQVRGYEALEYKPELTALKDRLVKMTDIYEQLVAEVTDKKEDEYLNFMARRLVESAGHCIMGYLLLQDATKNFDLFHKSAEVYINYAEAEVYKIRQYIENFNIESLESFRNGK